MSDPSFPTPSQDVPPPPPPGPVPFSGAPRPVVAGGCGKPIWIGCGLVFLLLAIAGIFLVTRAKDMLAWSFELMTPAVLQNAGADVTDEDKARFRAAVEAATARVKDGAIDTLALQAVQAQLQKAARVGPGSFGRADFLALVEALESLGGVEKAPAPVLPAPAPADAPLRSPDPARQVA
jgi:hypothetical protein